MKNLIWLFLLFSVGAKAQISPKTWEHESELAIVSVSGNTESESYSAKQKTSYSFEAYKAVAAASYLHSKASGVETAKSWDASLRLERAYSQLLSAYLAHGAEANTYAGYVQRDNTDIGAKYFLIPKDTTIINTLMTHTLLTELGYRYSSTIRSNFEKVYENFGRFYIEYEFKNAKKYSAKMWVEALPNFTDHTAYLINAEPSFSAVISDIFSLKVSNLFKYHNKTFAANEKYMDSIFTTAFVAKF